MVNKRKEKNISCFSLVLFCISDQLHNILFHFNHILGSIFPYVITEGVTDGRRNTALFIILIGFFYIIFEGIYLQYVCSAGTECAIAIRGGAMWV